MALKGKTGLIEAAMVARMMAVQWSDEYLESRTPQDLVAAYGCTEEAAKHILEGELTNRKLKKMKLSKESE